MARLLRLALLSSVVTLLAVPFGGRHDPDPRAYAFGWKPEIFAIGWKQLPVAPVRLVPFAWPALGTITSPYGVDGRRWHPGLDIGILRTLRVTAVARGRVVYAGYTKGFAGYGKVVVERSGKYLVVYAHLARVGVHTGERIGRGRRIGTAGCTGWCTGTHLHFEVRRGRRTVDPMRLLASS